MGFGSAVGLGAKHAWHGAGYGIGQGIKYTKAGIARTAVKKADKTIINPLGKKVTALGSAGIVAGTVAWGIGTGKIEGRQKTLSDNAEYVGNVGTMDYDGVANVDRKTGQRNFGATGDLVFGLNNSRRG
jgi:hypothetical protein